MPSVMQVIWSGILALVFLCNLAYADPETASRRWAGLQLFEACEEASVNAGACAIWQQCVTSKLKGASCAPDRVLAALCKDRPQL